MGNLLFGLVCGLVVCSCFVESTCTIQPDQSGFLDLSMFSDIGSETFSECLDLKSLLIGPHTRFIGDKAFFGCSNLVQVQFQEGIESIGKFAFMGTGLKSLVLPDTVQEVMDGAFKGIASMTYLNMGNGVSILYGEAFHTLTGLTGELLLGKNVSRVHAGAFAGCTGVTSLTLSEVPKLTLHFAAFDGSTSIKHLTVNSKVLEVHGSAFDKISIPSNQVYIRRSTTTITGLPSSMQEFKCSGWACNCNVGYGNTLAPNSDHFNCNPCYPGSTNAIPSQDACTLCGTGSYSWRSGSPICTLCSAGRFSEQIGAENMTACRNCEKGYYVSAPGASSCYKCPPGNHCGEEGLASFIPCSPGKYTDEKGQLHCRYCPSGRYQNNEGEAKCELCEVGKSSKLEGATQASTCGGCRPGTYTSFKGQAECISCTKGYYQPLWNSTNCDNSCELLDEFYTSNADFTGCEIDPAFLSENLLDTMFQKGVALYGTFTIAALFIALASFLQFHREKEPENITQISRKDCLLRSFLIGFSFGSEIFLMVGVFSDSQGIGSAMLIFRLMHLVGSLVIITAMFGPQSLKDLIDEYILEKSSEIRNHLNPDFARDNMPALGGLLIVSLGDITMLQFMPWKPTPYCDERDGYPTLHFMLFTLAIKSLQCLVSALCQISYLATHANLDDPTMSAQAKALFIMNIIFSMLSAIMGILLLLMKGGFLRDDTASAQSSEELPKKGIDDNEVTKTDFSSVYQTQQETGMTENPMMKNITRAQGTSSSDGVEENPGAC